MSDCQSGDAVKQMCNVNPSGNGMNGVVYDACAVGPTLTTNKGEGNKIAVPVVDGFNTEDDGASRPIKAQYAKNSVANFTRQDSFGATAVAMKMSTNSCTEGGDKEISAIWYEKYQCYIAIRKLTPKECFRLQGWTDDYFEKAEFVNSNSQLFKQAGNGVTVNVIEAIARKLG